MVVERVLMVVLDAPVDSLFLSNLFVDGTDRSKGDAILRSTASFRTSAYKSCRESQEAWSSCGQRFFQAVFVSRALSRAFEPFERLVRHPSASLRFQEEKERERLRRSSFPSFHFARSNVKIVLSRHVFGRPRSHASTRKLRKKKKEPFFETYHVWFRSGRARRSAAWSRFLRGTPVPAARVSHLRKRSRC